MENDGKAESIPDHFGDSAIYHRWKHPTKLIIPDFTNTKEIGERINSEAVAGGNLLLVADSVRTSEVLDFINNNSGKPIAIKELELATSQLYDNFPTYIVASDYAPHIEVLAAQRKQKDVNTEIALTSSGLGLLGTAFWTLIKDDKVMSRRDFIKRFTAVSSIAYLSYTAIWNSIMNSYLDPANQFYLEPISQDILTRNLVMQIKLEDYQSILGTEKQNTHMMLGTVHYAQNLQELTRKELVNVGEHVESSLLIEREYLRWKGVSPEEEQLQLMKMASDMTTSMLLKVDGEKYIPQVVAGTNSKMLFHQRVAPTRLKEMINVNEGNLEAGINDYVEFIRAMEF